MAVRTIPDWRRIGANTLEAPDRLASIGYFVAHGQPPRVVFDPRANTGVRLREDFIAWLLRHPHLRVARGKPFMAGGYSVRQVTGRVLRADPQALRAGYCGLTHSAYACLPITADPSAEGYVSWDFVASEVFRLWLVTIGRVEYVLYVTVQEPSPGEVRRTMPEADRIIRTLKVG